MSTGKIRTRLRTTQIFPHIYRQNVSALFVSLPRLNVSYSVDTDASGYGIGCTLFQTHIDRTPNPVGYRSQSLKRWVTRVFRSGTRALLRRLFITNASTVIKIRKSKDIQQPPCPRLAFQHIRPIRMPSSSANTSHRIWCWYKVYNCADNHHADALSRLFTWFPTFALDDKDNPAFQLAEQNYFNICSSTINYDCSHHEQKQKEYFLETDYEDIDHLIST